MLRILLAILIGTASPAGDWNGGANTTNSTTCNEDCTEDNHTCEDPNEPGPGGETGHVPPKK